MSRRPAPWLFVAALALVAGACGGDKNDEAPAKGPAPPPPGTTGAPSLKGDIAPPPPPKAVPKPAPKKVERPAAALGATVTECAINGAAYAGTCKDMRDLRVVPNGSYAYISKPGDGVRRFKVAEGDGCSLALDPSFGAQGLLAFPKDKPKPQRLNKKGGVFLSSGGASYKLAVSPKGDVVVYDFIRGVHRIAGPSGKVSCPDMRGTVDAMFAHGHLYTAAFSSIYRMKITKKGCKREKLKLPIEGMTLNRIGAWGKRMIVGGSGKGRRGKVVHLLEDGKVTLSVGNKDSFAADGMCWVNGTVPCGDGFCVLDGNCRSVKRFNADGSLRASVSLREILKRGLYGVYDLARGPDGAMWMALSHRDSKTDKCTLRTYRLRF